MAAPKSVSKSTLSFEDYKKVKKEILKEDEKIYEGAVSKHFEEFRKHLEENVDGRFNRIDNDLEIIEKRIMFITWFIPVVISVVYIALQIINKYI